MQIEGTSRVLPSISEFATLPGTLVDGQGLRLVLFRAPNIMCIYILTMADLKWTGPHVQSVK